MLYSIFSFFFIDITMIVFFITIHIWQTPYFSSCLLQPNNPNTTWWWTLSLSISPFVVTDIKKKEKRTIDLQFNYITFSLSLSISLSDVSVFLYIIHTNKKKSFFFVLWHTVFFLIGSSRRRMSRALRNITYEKERERALRGRRWWSYTPRRIWKMRTGWKEEK